MRVWSAASWREKAFVDRSIDTGAESNQHEPVAERFFPYDFDARFRWIWGPLGAKPGVDGVTLTENGQFIATFGRFRVETPLTNIESAKRTGPYRWWKALGLRSSAVDSGITFGTTSRGGVCVLFVEPIPTVIPPRSSHAGLTVTVRDRDGLVEALNREQGLLPD